MQPAPGHVRKLILKSSKLFNLDVLEHLLAKHGRTSLVMKRSYSNSHGIHTIEMLIRKSRLGKRNEIIHMKDHSILKMVTFGEPSAGSRRPGRPKKSWRESVKEDLKIFDIQLTSLNWENINKQFLEADRKKKEQIREERRRRKNKNN